MENPGKKFHIARLQGGVKGKKPLARIPKRGLAKKGDPSALARLTGKAPEKPGELLAKLKQGGARELAARQNETLEQQFKRRVEEAVAKLSAGLRIKLVCVLDYTASTISDVHNFVAETRNMVEQLNKVFPGGVTVIPVAVRGRKKREETYDPQKHTHIGEGEGYKGGPFDTVCWYEPEVLIGDEGDLNFFDGIEHGPYSVESPVGAGIDKLVKTGQLGGEKPAGEIQAAIIISDDQYRTYPEHEATLRALHQGEVRVASLSSARTDTHLDALSLLGENAVVINRADPEISAVNLVVEFIKNILNLRFQQKAVDLINRSMTSEKQAGGGKLKLGVSSLADRLRLQGHTKEAKNVLEVKDQKRLNG